MRCLGRWGRTVTWSCQRQGRSNGGGRSRTHWLIDGILTTHLYRADKPSHRLRLTTTELPSSACRLQPCSCPCNATPSIASSSTCNYVQCGYIHSVLINHTASHLIPSQLNLISSTCGISSTASTGPNMSGDWSKSLCVPGTTDPIARMTNISGRMEKSVRSSIE